MATTADVNETQSKTSKGQTYRSRLWVIASGAIPAGLYVLYVYHYALNVPLVDDWQVMPIVSKAIHGEIDIHAIWKQWSDGREVMGNLVFVAFAIVDHLNLRAVMLFNATVFVLTYVIVLLLFRGYLGKRLPPLSAFVLGVVWFSLVDGQSALWAVKVEGYLTIFFTLVTVSLLLIRRGDDRLLFSLSVVAAVMASFSFVAGFAVWPLGLICLLWQSKWDKMKIATWVIAGGLTSVSYFYGYSFGNSSCQTTGANCSLLQGLSHPIQLGQYLILLVGDVIPTSTGGIEAHLWVHDVQGIVLFIAALLVVVQTVRERHDQPSPLPLLLILFAILFDLTTTLARVGGGPQSAIKVWDGRFTMPNVILLLAIVIFGWTHAPKLHMATAIRFVGLSVLTALLLIQCVLGTETGISWAHTIDPIEQTDARILVNLGRVPRSEWACDFDAAVFQGWFKHFVWYQLARINELSMFQPGVERRYREEPPLVAPQCRATFGGATVSTTVERCVCRECHPGRIMWAVAQTMLASQMGFGAGFPVPGVCSNPPAGPGLAPAASQAAVGDLPRSRAALPHLAEMK